MAGSASLAQADALENITAAGTLRVAVPEDFAPFGMKGTDLKPIGYDIDVATHVAEKLGVTLKLVPVSGANRIPALQTDKVDLIISVLGKNAEREAVIDFANAYGVLHNAVYAEEGIDIAGPAGSCRQVDCRAARRDRRYVGDRRRRPHRRYQAL